MLLLRHFVLEEDGLYRANPAEEIMLRYYANAIAHLAARRRWRLSTPIACRIEDKREDTMLSETDRQKAADMLMEAAKTRKQATQLSVTFPGIGFEDAYAISTFAPSAAWRPARS